MNKADNRLLELSKAIKRVCLEGPASCLEGPASCIHAHACQHCPSVHTPDDPESLQIRDFASKEEKIESVFRCAWRREKACRGYCDFIGVTDEDIRSRPIHLTSKEGA
jgi:hypothetical protein